MKMAEPSEAHFRLISEIFCFHYNGIHKTNYSLREINDKQIGDYDLLISDNESILKIQHKRLESIPGFFRASGEMDPFQIIFEQMMKKYLKHVSLYIEINLVPPERGEKERLANYICYFINNQLRNNESHKRYREGDSKSLSFVFRYLSCLDIRKSRRKEPFVVWGNTHFGRCEELEKVISIDINRINEFDKHYSRTDTILLLESFPIYPGEIEINRYIDHFGGKDCNFNEIWIISTGNEGRCGRIYSKVKAMTKGQN